MNGKGVCVEWMSGPSAQLELFSPTGGGSETAYQLKYTPPFRSTIRSMVDLEVNDGDLDPIQKGLSQLIAGIEKAGCESDVLKSMECLGEKLITYILPQYVQSDLQGGKLFLEMGMDEALLNLPWELMYDGANFLCLKHSLGRYVNIRRSLMSTSQTPQTMVGQTLEKLRILLISVPLPKSRPGNESLRYLNLREAETETKAIVAALASDPDIQLETLIGKEATHDNVFYALNKGRYHILHYNGHAHFDKDIPNKSALVLYDRDMTTVQLMKTIGAKSPLLCFINACESAMSATGAEVENRLNLYGLARAFLETGSYLLGSRWKISDPTAAKFATLFYGALILDGKPIGQAIMEARQGCKDAKSTDALGWASYVYYGDPRIGFRRL